MFGGGLVKEFHWYIFFGADLAADLEGRCQMSLEMHRKLFNNLDNPVRFLVWTVPEALVLMAPIFGAVVSGYVFTSLAFGAVGFCALRAGKRRFGKQSLAAVLYWHFPHNKRKLKVTPPSYVRMYIG